MLVYEYFLLGYITVILSEILRLPKCSKIDGSFSEVYRNKRLVGSVIYTFKRLKVGGCIEKCLKCPSCQSVNFLDYQEESIQATGVCELNSEDFHSGGKAKLKTREKSTMLQTPQNQQNVSDCYASC